MSPIGAFLMAMFHLVQVLRSSSLIRVRVDFACSLRTAANTSACVLEAVSRDFDEGLAFKALWMKRSISMTWSIALEHGGCPCLFSKWKWTRSAQLRHRWFTIYGLPFTRAIVPQGPTGTGTCIFVILREKCFTTSQLAGGKFRDILQ